MNRDLQRAIKEDAYCIVEKLIYQKAWEFYSRYGGSYEEWRSEAMFIFVASVDTLDESKSCLSSWVWSKIHWGLTEIVRKRARQKIKYTLLGDITEDEDATFQYKRKNHTLSLIDHLTDSSMELFWLIVNPPDELDGILNPKDPDGSLAAIMWYCKHKLKWTENQIEVSIQELRELCQ